MAEPATTTTAQPPAATGGITTEQLNAAISSAVNAGIAAAMKPFTDAQQTLRSELNVVADTLTKLPPAGVGIAATKPVDAAKPVTADDINRLLDQRDQQRQQQQGIADQRKQFINGKVPKLPAVYTDRLGNDPTKWDAEATQLQQQYETDLKGNGFKPVDVTASPAVGASTAALPVDVSKMTESQQRAAALKAMPSVGPATSTPAIVTTTDMPGAPTSATAAAK